MKAQFDCSAFWYIPAFISTKVYLLGYYEACLQTGSHPACKSTAAIVFPVFPIHHNRMSQVRHTVIIQRFDAVVWVIGTPSGLSKTLLWGTSLTWSNSWKWAC